MSFIYSVLHLLIWSIVGGTSPVPIRELGTGDLEENVVTGTGG